MTVRSSDINNDDEETVVHIARDVRLVKFSKLSRSYPRDPRFLQVCCVPRQTASALRTIKEEGVPTGYRASGALTGKRR